MLDQVASGKRASSLSTMKPAHAGTKAHLAIATRNPSVRSVSYKIQIVPQVNPYTFATLCHCANGLHHLLHKPPTHDHDEPPLEIGKSHHFLTSLLALSKSPKFASRHISVCHKVLARPATTNTLVEGQDASHCSNILTSLRSFYVAFASSHATCLRKFRSVA